MTYGKRSIWVCRGQVAADDGGGGAEDPDDGFYMSAESSYNEGKWKTAPFQVAILNAMGNDLIRVVNFVKSARIGYTKMLMANIGYKIQHKRRNVLMWSRRPRRRGSARATLMA